MTEEFDVAIIGGGITGASIARDCALRYIDYDVGLIRISAQEVAILQRIAPHLLTPIKFLIPFFPGSRHNIEIFETALEAYEAIVCPYGAPKHQRLTADEVLRQEPLL